FYGNLQGRFDGSGTRLLLRGLLMWLVVVPPIIIGTILSLNAQTLRAIGKAGASTADIFGAVAMASIGPIWSTLAIIALFPLFQAMVLRWWIDGVRFGDVAAAAHLRTSAIYGIYLRFLAYALLL